MNDGTQNNNSGTGMMLSDAELAELRQKAARADELEAKIRAREELAAELGYDSVEAMDEAGLEAIEQVDRQTLASKTTQPAKPKTETPPAKQPEPAPQRSTADALAMEIFLDNQFIKYTMNMAPEDRAKVDERAMKKAFNDNRALSLEHAKTTGNVFSAVADIVRLKTPPAPVTPEGVEKAKAEAATTAHTTTGQPIPEKKVDDQKKQEEEYRRRIAPVTFTPPK